MRRLWTEITLLGVAYVLGDAFSAPPWVTIVIVCLIGLAAISWAIEQWRTRATRRAAHQAAHNHAVATQSDRWKRGEDARRYAVLVEAFWDSPMGRRVDRAPYLANQSLSIEPIGQPPTRQGGLGAYSVQISETHVAHLQMILPAARRDASWLSRLRQ